MTLHNKLGKTLATGLLALVAACGNKGTISKPILLNQANRPVAVDVLTYTPQLLTYRLTENHAVTVPQNYSHGVKSAFFIDRDGDKAIDELLFTDQKLASVGDLDVAQLPGKDVRYFVVEGTTPEQYVFENVSPQILTRAEMDAKSHILDSFRTMMK